jgi:ABC-2 type transport system ATP-binding protein
VVPSATLLLTTQYLDEADRLADQIVVLNSGRVVAAGPPARLKSDLGGERVDVVVRRAGALAGAATAVRAALGAVPDVRPGERRLTIAAPGGSAVLIEVVRALDGAGVEVEDIALRHPTLDEVFLTLTAEPSTVEAYA